MACVHGRTAGWPDGGGKDMEVEVGNDIKSRQRSGERRQHTTSDVDVQRSAINVQKNQSVGFGHWKNVGFGFWER